MSVSTERKSDDWTQIIFACTIESDVCILDFTAGQVSDTTRSVAQAAKRRSSIGGGLGATLGLVGPAASQSASTTANGRPAKVHPRSRIPVQLLWQTVRHVVELENAFESAHGREAVRV